LNSSSSLREDKSIPNFLATSGGMCVTPRDCKV
jgi:hypothetical protein